MSILTAHRIRVQEVHGKGNYLVIRSFLGLLPNADTPATIVNPSSWQSFFTVPPLGAYSMSKLLLDALAAYVAAEYPNVNAVSMHPGLVATDMLREPIGCICNIDSPALVGGTTVWLCQAKARFLSGRFIAANWGVQNLLSRRHEIVEKDLLKLTLQGDFGV